MAVSPLSPSMASSSPTSRPSHPASAAPATLLSSLNPLHHIPVVSTVYGEITGTRPVPAVRIFAAAALAGPLGFVAALADALLEEATGRTAGGHVVAALAGEPTTAIASGPSGTDTVMPSREQRSADTYPTASTGDRSVRTTTMPAPDGHTPRGVARVYLLDLALQHSVKAADAKDGTAQV